MNEETTTEVMKFDRCLDFDPDEFERKLGYKPFIIEHRLVGHPQFELPRLIELARQLPESNVEYNAGNVPVSLDPKATPRTGLSIEETIRRIEECQSWMVLKNVELHADCRRLLDICLEEVRQVSERKFPGMYKREAFIFISSPGSVTPFHLDPEFNFLLQIRGRKEMHVFDGMDRRVLPEQSLEEFYSGASRNLTFEEEFGNRASVFELTPGKALHVPVAFPHWVKNGPEVSISFSITFLTNDSYRRAALYRINHGLRRLGIRPAPVGSSTFRDDLKYRAFRALRAVRSLVKPGQNETNRKYGQGPG